MSNLPTNKTDGTAMAGDHAANHNNTNKEINNLGIWNVLRNGAKGDGSTNDGGAFNTTIGLGNRILVPDTLPGYLIATTVSTASNQILEGNGYATLLKLTNAANISCVNQSHVKIRELRIDGTNIASNGFCLLVNNPTDVTVDGVWVLNANGFGIFLDADNGATNYKVRVKNCYLSGLGNSDVLGGGPANATSFLAELIISGNFIVQNVNNTGTYYNALDIVAQQKTVIANNVTQGNIILGGEKIPHYEVNVMNNVVGQAPGSNMARIAVLCASNAGQSADSSCINIIGNQINGGSNGGQIFVQGQSSTSNRTRKVVIKGNNIVGGNTNTETCWGFDLSYLADVVVEGNVVDGDYRGIYVNDVQGIDISNNRFINCTTPIVIGGTPPTNMTGHNNVGINPDVLYAQGNVTGATTFDRVNGIHITATQTANITVTMPSTFFKGELLTLEIVTGGFTQAWPANFKIAGGAATLTMTGTSLVTARYDGTNWIEVSRALNVS